CLFRDELQFTACLRSIEQTNCELETRSDAIVLAARRENAAYRKIEHECNTEEHVMRQQDEAIERDAQASRTRNARSRAIARADPEYRQTKQENSVEDAALASRKREPSRRGSDGRPNQECSETEQEHDTEGLYPSVVKVRISDKWRAVEILLPTPRDELAHFFAVLNRIVTLRSMLLDEKIRITVNMNKMLRAIEVGPPD
uniref:Uncharacterized protein n=1 Tax=Glossina palpalis gambiensis TaxID=67801 RepID=A0A1B0BNK2_9MUSC